MSLLGMFRTTGTLQRQVVAKDADGGKTSTWANVSGATAIACDIQPAGSSVVMRFAQRQMNCTHSVYVGGDIAARDTDRFVIGSRVFKILGYEPPAPGYSQWPGTLQVEESYP